MRFLFEARPAPDAGRPRGLARALSVAEQQALLQYAREAVIDAVTRGDLPRVMRDEGIFGERCGVFVTLHLQQRLRGCIGVVETDEPLGGSLVRCAASAALSDPRFPPVRQDELPDLRIEISLLSRPEPIRPEAIEIGRHGLLVVGDKRGLLLPQVAVEHHLTREQFLAETCRKAGLPPEAWRQPASSLDDACASLPEDACRVQIFAFTCQVFSESPTRV